MLVARVPDNPAVAIVGYYLLFVTDSTGLPSTGRFTQICASGRRRPPWIGDDWWDWRRNLLSQGGRLGAREIPQMRRDLLGPVAPPRRRLFVERQHDHRAGAADMTTTTTKTSKPQRTKRTRR